MVFNHTKNIELSIIIINYNANELLNSCLQSVYEQTRGIIFEIFIVDNNSIQSDIKKINMSYENIRLIKNNTNIGFATANNQGIAIARGKYILFLNNDTIFFENSLKKVLDFAESFNEETFIGCKLLNYDGTHQFSVVDFDNILNAIGENLFLYRLFPRSKIFNRYHKNYDLPASFFEVDVIKGAFMFCSSSAIKRLNGFDSRFYFYGEESDLCLRFKKSGGKIIFYPGTSIYHLAGATVNKNVWFKFKNQHIAKIQKYQKHFKGVKFLFLILIYYSGILIRIPAYFIEGIIKSNSKMIRQSSCYFKMLLTYPKNVF